jgi:hypothetical protein
VFISYIHSDVDLSVRLGSCLAFRECIVLDFLTTGLLFYSGAFFFGGANFCGAGDLDLLSPRGEARIAALLARVTLLRILTGVADERKGGATDVLLKDGLSAFCVGFATTASLRVCRTSFTSFF